MPSRRVPGCAARPAPSSPLPASPVSGRPRPLPSGAAPGRLPGLAAGPGAPGGALWAGDPAHRPRGISPSPARPSRPAGTHGPGRVRLPAAAGDYRPRDCGQGSGGPRSVPRHGGAAPLQPSRCRLPGVPRRCQPVTVSEATRTQLLQVRVECPSPRQLRLLSQLWPRAAGSALSGNPRTAGSGWSASARRGIYSSSSSSSSRCQPKLRAGWRHPEAAPGTRSRLPPLPPRGRGSRHSPVGPLALPATAEAPGMQFPGGWASTKTASLPGRLFI